MKNNFTLSTPEENARQLAKRARDLRLARNWKQSTLATRAGVSLGSLQRFERSGLVSLQNLLKLAFALDRLADFEYPLQPPPAGSIAELEATVSPHKPRRGAQ